MHQGEEFVGDRPHVNGLQAVAAGQNGHFHAGSRRQIVDQAVVAHVAVEGVQLAVPEEGVENAGGVLVAALEVGRFVEKFFQIGVVVCFPFFPDFDGEVGAARVPAGASVAVFFQQVVPFAEPRTVLGKMSAGFGHIIPQRQKDLVANDVLVIHRRIVQRALPQGRVQVFSVVGQLQIIGQMIDAGAGVFDFIHRDIQNFAEFFNTVLYAVAQAGGEHLGRGLLHGAAKHGHGVGVVQKDRAGAVALNVLQHVQHDGNGAQKTENARRVPGVAHIDLNTVLFADFQITPKNLQRLGHQHTQHAVRPGKHLRAIGGADQLGGVMPCVNDVLHRTARVFQPFGVDVYQSDGRVGKSGKGENVPNQIAGENVAARADENKFPGHLSFLLFKRWKA